MISIKQIAATGKLFKGYNFSDEEQEEVLAFMYTNKGKLREMSLRMALKIGDLKKINSDKWQALAASTCMKRV